MNRVATSIRTVLAASTAGAALALTGPATAQQPPPREVTIDEIVVTAQKREERLQDVPVSISVISGEQLVETGAVQLLDIAPYIPGFQVDNTGSPGRSTMALRGIVPIPIGASASVSVHLDEAPVGSSTAYARAGSFTLDLLPYDIQRIEVLRGPQGTLYGASSIGGLVKYVTVSPSLDETTVRAGTELFHIQDGSGLGYGAHALLNAPLAADRVGLTMSAAYRKTPGWVDNVETGRRDQNEYDQLGGRLSLLWHASERLSARLSGIWQEIDSDDNGTVIEDLDGQRIGDGRSNFNFRAEPFRSTFYFYSGTLDYDLGATSLTSITTYSRSDLLEITDLSRMFGALFPLLTGGAVPAGITPFDTRIDLGKVTQELRLASQGAGRFEWLLGAFFTREWSAHDQLVNSFDMAGVPIDFLDPLATVSLPSRYREYAGFGNATFKVTERFDFGFGMRWARNDQRFRQISAGAIVPEADDPGESSESVFTYSLSPQFHLSEDAMLYGRVATGYRPGGPNVTLPGVPPTFDSDTVTSYEVGLKAMVFDHRLQFDIAAFYMDWDDIQVGITFGGVGGIGNGPSARSQGVEASLVWLPVDGLTLGLTGAYTDARLTEDAPDISGQDRDRLPRIPKWSGALTADYRFAVGRDAIASFGGGLRNRGSRYSNVESNPLAIEVPAYTALDLHAAVSFGDRWTLRAFARNVTDSDKPVTRSLSVDGLNTPTHISVVPLQPRTVGLAVDISF